IKHSLINTHTHTHAGRPEVAVNLSSAFIPSWAVLPPGQPGAVGSLCGARGPSQVIMSSPWPGTDSRVIFSVLRHVFLLGFLVEETPCEHREDMQTPHRKAREIAHLSTEGLGRTCPPEPTAPHAGIESPHTHTMAPTLFTSVVYEA